jgi:hypothetical protein
MSIVHVSQEKTVLAAALAYARLGFSVVAIKGKLASVKWIPLQARRASMREIAYWHNRGLLTSVGVITGAVSGNLAVMDLDSLQTVSKFEFTFPELLNTYTVASNRGKHIYWYVDRLPQTTKTDGYELRADKCYVVAPPSVHPSGKRYTVENPVEIARVPHLDHVVEFIDAIKADKQRESDNQRSQNTEQKPAIKNLYAQTALDRECTNVRTATEGNANDQLNLSAFKLGQLVQLGYLTASTVESALLGAAAGLSARDGENLTIKTIRSGLTAGMTKPIKSRKAIK